MRINMYLFMYVRFPYPPPPPPPPLYMFGTLRFLRPYTVFTEIELLTTDHYTT